MRAGWWILPSLAVASAFMMAHVAVASAATLQQAVEGCNATRGDRSDSAGVLELLVLAGSDVDPQAQARYKSIAGDAIAWACVNSATLEIRPIDARSREEAYVYSATAPSARDGKDNPYILRDKRAAFVYRAWAAVDALYQRPQNPRADFFGAIETAATAANSMGEGKRVTIVVVGHGWQQQSPDLYAAGRDPATSTAGFITALRARRQPPDFHNAAVVFVGVSSGPHQMGQSPYLSSLCDEFWLHVIRAGKGSWRGCWPELPAFLRVAA